MISIEQCRELIPNGHTLTDEQIDEIRESLSDLAEMALENFMKSE